MIGGKACSTYGAGYVTTCHRDHIHFSFSWAGANRKTSYFTGSVPCPNPTVQPAFTAAMPINMTAVPVTPSRVFSTLSGAGACRLQPKGRLDVKVTGVGGVPSTGVGAVALNITGVKPTGAATYFSVFPAGTPGAGTSALNIPANGTTSALVVVPVGSDGRVSIRNGAAPVDVIVDVVAYFTTATTGSRYTSTPEQRILDTRQSTILVAGERRKVQVGGAFGVPANATGVLVNVTSSGSTGNGNIALAPTFGPVVASATLVYRTADTIANRAVAKLAADGSLEVYSSNQTHVQIDLLGWFAPGTTGLRYNPVLPGKILDTRNGLGGVPTLSGGVPADVAVAGQGGIPADAHSVVATLTVIAPTAATSATMWAAGDAKPSASDITVPQGVTRDALVSRELSDVNGKASLAVGAGSANAVLSVLGYFR